jgi:hypothetical protein
MQKIIVKLFDDRLIRIIGQIIEQFSFGGIVSFDTIIEFFDEIEMLDVDVIVETFEEKCRYWIGYRSA